MNKIIFISLPLLANVYFSCLQAQSEASSALGGYWRMTNPVLGMEDYNYLKINPLEDGKFTATYLNKDETVELSGSIHDVDLINVTEISKNSNYNAYNGILQADGSINGFYSNKNTNLGRFTWVKVCDDFGNVLMSGELPCVEQKKESSTTMTRMVKKLIQVEDRVPNNGEARNENLPLAETVTEIPENAIIVGSIDEGETVTYRTVEVEVPEEIPVESSITVPVNTNKANSTVNTTKKISVKPDYSAKTIPNSYDNASEKIVKETKPKFTVCDAGSSNPNAVIAAMVRGTTVIENGHTYHIVGTGETMTAISKLYNVPIMQLAELNRKDCERIKDGEKLFIK